MKKKIILFLAFLNFALINAQTTVNTVLKDFEIIKVYNGIALELVKSDQQKVVITGNKADKAVIKQNGNTLKIVTRFPETFADNQIKATLYFNKEISVIDANEGAVVTAKSIEQPELKVTAKEGAFINLVVHTELLMVKATSAGVIKLSGTTKNQTVDISLGATYHGYNIDVSDISTIKAGSGAKAEIKTGKTLDAKVSFGGSIFYKGIPKYFHEKKVIGGTIEQRE